MGLALGAQAGEAKLRFRAVAAMRSRSHNALTPVLDSMRLGVRHFGVITAHTWVLRLVIVAISVAGVIVPMVLVESLLVPRLARMWGIPAIYPISLFLFSSGAVLVIALCATFSALYDARLALRLDPRGE